MKYPKLLIGCTAVLAALVGSSLFLSRPAPVRHAQSLALPIPGAMAYRDLQSGLLTPYPQHNPSTLPSSIGIAPDSIPVGRTHMLSGGGFYAEYDFRLAPRTVARIDENGKIVIDCIHDGHVHPAGVATGEHE